MASPKTGKVLLGLVLFVCCRIIDEYNQRNTDFGRKKIDSSFVKENLELLRKNSQSKFSQSIPKTYYRPREIYLI